MKKTATLIMKIGKNTGSVLLFFLSFSVYLVHGQITYPKSVSFGGFTQVSINPTTSSNSSTPQHLHPPVPMGATAQDIINQQNNRVPLYGTGLDPNRNQQINHTHIRQQMVNDPRYQIPNTGGQQTRQQKQHAEIKAILEEDLPVFYNAEEALKLQQTKFYRQAFAELVEMQKGEKHFSLKKAVFLVENTYLDNTLDYQEYSKRIDIKVNALKMLMRKEKVSENNNLGKNYLIQKLFSERIVEYKDTVVWRVHKPYSYDYDDFLGENDWTKMFVSKLLQTGKGQCHSMPLLYLILAEEINAKAWLSLAPQHSFIIFSNGNMYFNYETTIGNPASLSWVMESGYINSTSIKNGIYLDTLDRNGLMSILLADLIMGYTNKFGYDNFMAMAVDTLLSIYPKSIQGQIFKADLLALETKTNLKKAGNPPVEQISRYPQAHKSYTSLMQQYEFIDNLGYAHMPKERYEAWLLSLNDEKKNDEKRKLKTTLIKDVKANN